MELTAGEAMTLIDRVGHSKGDDFTANPVFPEGRMDVCVVRRLTEGWGCSFETIYLVWKRLDGSVGHEELASGRPTNDYITVESVEVVEDGDIFVKFMSTDTPRVIESRRVTITGDCVRVSKEAPSSYTERAKLAMKEVVKNHLHDHSLYQPTAVKELVIDEEREIAVFILFEQIDTDRCSESGDGWLGDQFRYSVWKMDGDCESVRLYEDHAYIRPRSKDSHTGTRGRDCSLKNLRLEGDVIKVMHLKGDRVEEQELEELTFNL